MVFKKYLLGFSLGYIAVIILVYFIFDWFSLSFLLGSIMGLGIFVFVLKGLLKKGK